MKIRNGFVSNSSSSSFVISCREKKVAECFKILHGGRWLDELEKKNHKFDFNLVIQVPYDCADSDTFKVVSTDDFESVFIED